MYQEILDFWFSDEVRKLWFNSTPAFDRLLGERYEGVLAQAVAGDLDSWQVSAQGCLALVIVLDQLPLNIHRGKAESFATESQSVAVAKLAIDKGFDQQLPPQQRAFLYMPFMHSENLHDQQRSLELFSQPGLEDNQRFASHHYEIVKRFGRFPHRNAALGRESSDAEVEYLNSKEAFRG